MKAAIFDKVQKSYTHCEMQFFALKLMFSLLYAYFILFHSNGHKNKVDLCQLYISSNTSFPEFALYILGSGNGDLSYLTLKAFYSG
jgi:hypothetical protein